MPNLSELTTSRLKRILAIMELIETLQDQAGSIACNSDGHISETPLTKRSARRAKKQGSQKRKKTSSPARTKLAAVSSGK